MLLPQTDSEQALALSRRVEAVFAEMLRPLQLEVAVSMDHGIAIFPQDAEQADQLIRIADERLYRQKHDNHKRTVNGASRIEPAPSAETVPAASADVPGPLSPPIPIETKRTQEKPENNREARPPANSVAASAEVIPAPRMFAVQRKAERVSMAGTNAYAVLGEQGAQLQLVEAGRELGEVLPHLGLDGVVVLLDPELPQGLGIVEPTDEVVVGVEVVADRRELGQQTAQGGVRIGCSFVS